ncbi:MAG: class II aldolase/adducin family protein [Gammaproteobacteria bacterium]|nr:class II aldolase/adducin family protein [Gammaproteobacteria bacterium]
MHQDSKADLIQYYHWLRQYGLNDSHSGNLSIRHGKTIWVTPSGACADTLTEDDLIACDIETGPGKGASLDAPLHIQCYRNNPNINAVMHSHGVHTVALTMDVDKYVPVDFEGHYYFGSVPVLKIDYDNYVSEAPQRVAETLQNTKITVVGGHGVYAAAETLNLAYKWTCSLELSAKTDFIRRMALQASN